jgi:hypothetical protein
MPGGHSTLNTVVLGEGVSQSKYTSYFGHHSCLRSCCVGDARAKEICNAFVNLVAFGYCDEGEPALGMRPVTMYRAAAGCVAWRGAADYTTMIARPRPDTCAAVCVVCWCPGPPRRHPNV